MDTYLIRFLEMVEELRALSEVQILHFELFDGLHPHDITALEELWGSPFDSTLRDFYQASNGLQLRWIHKKNPRFDPHQHVFLNEGFYYLDPLDWYGPEDGCINILPLQVAFFERNWLDLVSFDYDQSFPIDFTRAFSNSMEQKDRIKPFDIFGKSSGMLFVLEEKWSSPMVLLAQEHYFEIASSKITDFESYLEFLLHTRGLISERRRFYAQHNGYQMAPIKTPATYWNKMERVNLRSLYTS